VYPPAIERHERLCGSRAPVPVQEVTVLRVLLVGLFAFVLVTQAAAAAMQGKPATASRKAKQERKAETLDERLAEKRAAARKYRGTVAFFKSHRRLLSSENHGPDAKTALQHAERRLAALSKTIRTLQSAIQKREVHRREAALPKAAICNVFGQYCRQAVAVAWCESRLTTTAQNGQYLGLFQMGAYERQLFGHGSTARTQAEAAHEYFVSSGRDWSPWSCKPGYAM
jgi:Lysozyme like domain